MRHNQVIYLISTTISEDAIGNQLEEPTESKIFANEMSVGSKEFYGAAQSGLRPSRIFEIYSFEYGGQRKLRCADTVYRIIRTESRGEKTRLVCENLPADG